MAKMFVFPLVLNFTSGAKKYRNELISWVNFSQKISIPNLRRKNLNWIYWRPTFKIIVVVVWDTQQGSLGGRGKTTRTKSSSRDSSERDRWNKWREKNKLDSCVYGNEMHTHTQGWQSDDDLLFVCRRQISSFRPRHGFGFNLLIAVYYILYLFILRDLQQSYRSMTGLILRIRQSLFFICLQDTQKGFFSFLMSPRSSGWLREIYWCLLNLPHLGCIRTVSHPSSNWAQRCLTSVIVRDMVFASCQATVPTQEPVLNRFPFGF